MTLLENTFGSGFDEIKFSLFTKEFLKNFDITPKIWPVWKEYLDYIDSFQVLGSYKQGKNVIDVLIVKLKRSASVGRARTMQRNFIAKFLSGTEKDAALVAFYYEGETDWRYSFVKMEYHLTEGEGGKIKLEKDLTPAKRYSFLVGKNEPNYTCKKQFLDLIQNNHLPSMRDIELAFSIEKVTQEFFTEYKNLYLDLKEAIDQILTECSHLRKEFEDKDISSIDFSKKLLGQIVFIYFLQKKGWLGIQRNNNSGFQHWGSGPKDFLMKLFKQEIIQYNNFFNDILEPLFYEALSVERDDDYYSRFNCKIPFLNGGLFEPIGDYNWVDSEIIIDNSIFQKILETFSRYNFTIKEDEPLEKEVAIDPEMLGKVFENLLEIDDRISTGSFYTPREIVHYMCQQSLISYLEMNTSIPRLDLEKFIQFGEFTKIDDDKQLVRINELDSIIHQREKVDTLLKNVKIVDPAVGSGAFPVGIMTEIVRARSVLSPFFHESERKNRTDYNLKRETIENCLYGVDIDSSAVEIAKLRFWLSLIVDEMDMKNIQPLPNLDHKIMVGNSLLEEFEGVKLFNEQLLGEPSKQTFELNQIDHTMKKLYSEYGEIYKGIRSSVSGRMQEILKELKMLERKKKMILSKYRRNEDDLQATLEDALQHKIKQSRIKFNELNNLQKRLFNEHDRKTKKQYIKQIEQIEWDLIEETLKEQNNESAMRKLRQFKKSRSKPFFLWKLQFSEIFQRDNPGFDIVIANPPYLEARSPKFSDDLKRVLQKQVKEKYPSEYHLISQGSDLLVYFYLRSVDILNKSGFVSFLTQNAWLDTEYGFKFQKFISKKVNIIAIIDSDFKYFESANINTVITFFSGKNVDENNKVLILNFHKNIEKTPYTLSELRCGIRDEDYVTCKEFKQSDLIQSNYKWGFLMLVDNIMLEILTKLEKVGTTVDKIEETDVSIGQGLNVSKEYFIPSKFVANKKDFIPIMTSDDGAPFVLKKTQFYLAPVNGTSKDITHKLKSNGFKLIDLSKTSKIPPKLILPRGIGRHYCSINEVEGYSSSGVDVYIEPFVDIIVKRLWIFLNSSLSWLLRELSGRKNLGGGMLKAEAIDMKTFPIYLTLETSQCDSMYASLECLEAITSLDEIRTIHHKNIDKLVFDVIGLSLQEREYVVNKLYDLISRRSRKSKTKNRG